MQFQYCRKLLRKKPKMRNALWLVYNRSSVFGRVKRNVVCVESKAMTVRQLLCQLRVCHWQAKAWATQWTGTTWHFAAYEAEFTQKTHDQIVATTFQLDFILGGMVRDDTLVMFRNWIFSDWEWKITIRSDSIDVHWHPERTEKWYSFHKNIDIDLIESGCNRVCAYGSVIKWKTNSFELCVCRCRFLLSTRRSILVSSM